MNLNDIKIKLNKIYVENRLKSSVYGVAGILLHHCIIYLSVCMSICLSVCLSVCLYVCLYELYCTYNIPKRLITKNTLRPPVLENFHSPTLSIISSLLLCPCILPQSLSPRSLVIILPSCIHSTPVSNTICRRHFIEYLMNIFHSNINLKFASAVRYVTSLLPAYL